MCGKQTVKNRKKKKRASPLSINEHENKWVGSPNTPLMLLRELVEQLPN